MSRPLRIAYPGAWYHVMNRGLAHNSIFVDDSHRQCFLDLLFEIHVRYQVEIHAFCLMENHYHILIHTQLGNISRVMNHLDGIYTQRFNRSVNRDGPLFRGRYKSILVGGDAYLLQLSRYIHLNAVKANLVQKHEEFCWSSYRAYLSGNPPSWLNINYTLSYFGDSPIEKYKSFVEMTIDDEIDGTYNRSENISILGSEEFIKTVSEKYLKEDHKINDIPEHKLLVRSADIDIETLLQCVATFNHINLQDIKSYKKGNGNQAQAIAMYLAHRIGQYTYAHISFQFCSISLAGVSNACQRLRTQMKDDERLRAEVESLERVVRGMSNVKD